MSTLDSGPSINRTVTSSDEKTKSKPEEQHLEETFPKTAKPFTEEARFQIEESALATLSPLLVIVRVTIIFIFAILADTLIILIIRWSFDGIVSHYFFAAKLLEGIQFLSA